MCYNITRTSIPHLCSSRLFHSSSTLLLNGPIPLSHLYHHDTHHQSLQLDSNFFGSISRTHARLHKIVESLAQHNVTPVTLQELLRMGTIIATDPTALIRNAKFLQKELPIRLARRVKAFEELPFIVAINPHIQSIHTLYLNSLDRMTSFPPITNSQHERDFSAMMSDLVVAHTNVITTISQGFIECRQYLDADHIGTFLDQLITARIGIRVLAQHHLALSHPQPKYIGIVNTQLSPAKLAQSVYYYINEIAQLQYGMCPELKIDGMTSSTMAYIPMHLEYILAELYKNSIRATIEHHVPPSQRSILSSDHINLPPIRLTIAQTNNDVAIRIRDEGGGVPYEKLRRIFEYSYSTVPNRRNSFVNNSGSSDHDNPNPNSMSPFNQCIPKSTTNTSMVNLNMSSDTGMEQSAGGPIAGLGYGLGMVRVYSKYFGGSLRMVSLYGHGCDVFLRLPNLVVSTLLLKPSKSIQKN